MYDLLVRGGIVVTPTGAEALDVAVEDETIAAIDQPGALGTEATQFESQQVPTRLPQGGS
jgi:hypothetical protein